MENNKVICPLCYMPSAEWRVSKKNNKPFFFCANCNTMTFLNTQTGLNGLKDLVDKATIVAVEKMKKFFPEALQNTGSGALEKVLQEIRVNVISGKKEEVKDGINK